MGEKIKELRLHKLMTQAELAKKSGVSRTTIVALEHNKDTTTTKTLAKIAKALEVNVEDIFFANTVK